MLLQKLKKRELGLAKTSKIKQEARAFEMFPKLAKWERDGLTITRIFFQRKGAIAISIAIGNRLKRVLSIRTLSSTYLFNRAREE